MSNDLSLFDIERGLNESVIAWQEAESPEQMEAAELALRTYAELELRKADGYIATIRSYEAALAHRKAERDRQAAAVKMIESRIGWLKSFAQGCMSAWGKKRIDGKSGSLVLKGNGGVAPLTIANRELVPDDMMFVSIRMSLSTWKYFRPFAVDNELVCEVSEPEPNNSAIRFGLDYGDGVPGCRLEPRGEHIEIK